MRKLPGFIFIAWCVGFLAPLAHATPSSLTAVEEISPAMRHQLVTSNSLEHFIFTVTQPIRTQTKSGTHIEQADIDNFHAQHQRREVAQQVSRLLVMDTNGDGIVSQEEVEAHMATNANPHTLASSIKNIMKHDINGDGKIDYDEMRTLLSTRTPPSLNLQDLLALDPDKDGKLTVEELKTLAIAAFNALDTDKDGVLSKEEKLALNTLPRPPRVTAPPQQDEDFRKFLSQIPKNAEVHSVAVYEAAKRNADGIGEVKVTLARKGVPIVLYLSSYGHVDWKVSTEQGATLAGVFLGGAKSKLAKRQEEVPVLPVRQYASYTINDNGLESFRSELQKNGFSLSSWQGHYKGEEFSVTDDFMFYPQKTFSWPQTVKLPQDTEVQVVDVMQGKMITQQKQSNIKLGDKKARPTQEATVTLEPNPRPVLLVLSAPGQMVWHIDNPHDATIASVILAGPMIQYLHTRLENIPIVMWPDQKAGLHQSPEYAKLEKALKEQLQSEVTGYTGVSIADSPVTVAAGQHFPSGEDTIKQTGVIPYPDHAEQWDKAGEYGFTVPKDCKNLLVMAWGAGGSWGYGGNAGSGGAFVHSRFEGMGSKKLQVIVGGGGKVGTHLTEKDGERITPSPGKGGFPDGGDGGTGYDATGGGGGGSTRLVLNKEPLVIAGGGGGGGGHGSEPGAGGSTISPSSGKEGQGSKAQAISGPRIGDDPLKPGTDGGPQQGGKGGDGGRKGGGGGGGGKPDFHFPGGGGGGGSLGQDIRAGILGKAAGMPIPVLHNTGGGIPGNAKQAGSSGYGGAPTNDGTDGKLILWCEDALK